MSNTWVTYLRVGDNVPKGTLIPHNILPLNRLEIKAGDRKTWRLMRGPRLIS